jgi:hypothetical protein
MTVRQFSTGDVILLSPGSLGTVLQNAFSICFVVRRTSETDYANIIGFLVSGENRGGLWLTNTGLVQVVCSGLDAAIAGLDVPLNKWMYVGVDKLNGDGVSPRGHLKNLTDNTAMQHATAAGTVNEDSGTVTSICIGGNSDLSDYWFPGYIAGGSVLLGATWSDLEHEENAASFQAMIDNGADALWDLVQTGTPPAIVNDRIGTANQTNQGADGTNAAEGIDPENFNMNLGGGTTTVTSDLDVRWSVATRVNSDLDVRWAVSNRVNSDLDVRWSVANRVTSDLDVQWSVANRVSSDLDVRWQVANQVTSDLAVLWNVEGATTQVVSDLDVRWSVANQVTSDLDIRWSVYNSVNSDLDVRWAVANLVTSDLSVRWSVEGEAPSSVESWGLQV